MHKKSIISVIILLDFNNQKTTNSKGFDNFYILSRGDIGISVSFCGFFLFFLSKKEYNTKKQRTR